MLLIVIVIVIDLLSITSTITSRSTSWIDGTGKSDMLCHRHAEN